MAENIENQEIEILMDRVEDSYYFADVNVLYWPKLCLKYYRYDKWMKIFLAITALITAAGWVISFASSKNITQVLWIIPSLLSAITAVTLPILDWPRKIQLATKLGEKWLDIQREYDRLWLNISQMYPDEVKEQYNGVRDKELLVEKEGWELPHTKKRLINKCENEVRILRGIDT